MKKINYDFKRIEVLACIEDNLKFCRYKCTEEKGSNPYECGTCKTCPRKERIEQLGAIYERMSHEQRLENR